MQPYLSKKQVLPAKTQLSPDLMHPYLPKLNYYQPIFNHHLPKFNGPAQIQILQTQIQLSPS